LNRIYKIIATAGGLGYAPKAPGTLGALGAFVIALIGINFSNFDIIFLTLSIIFTILGVFVSDKLESEWGSDPSRIVIDEVIGYWISILFLPKTFTVLIVGFIFFRFFDIVKPLGIRKLDNLKNGWGVMLDDVLAGIYSNLVLQVLIHFKLF
jgi:phosphatidylglycerophosphatase A